MSLVPVYEEYKLDFAETMMMFFGYKLGFYHMIDEHALYFERESEDSIEPVQMKVTINYDLCEIGIHEKRGEDWYLVESMEEFYPEIFTDDEELRDDFNE